MTDTSSSGPPTRPDDSPSEAADTETLPGPPSPGSRPGADDHRKDPKILARGSTLDRYFLLERLGSGGMGVVYAAYDPKLDRKIAIKVLRSGAGGSELTPGHGARLLREAKALAQLSHPNVISVYDAVSIDGQLILAMEFVKGQSLDVWLKDQERSSAEILQAFQEAGRGLAAAHAAGLVHRDFKASNVMVREDGRVQVLDFGLAKSMAANDAEAPMVTVESLREGLDRPAAAEAAATRTGAVLGTPAFMAPEQLAGLPADPAADQFSFCVALWQALQGELPFSPSQGLRSPGDETAWRIRGPEHQRKIPSSLRPVLIRGVSFHAQDRYPSMAALLANLDVDSRRSRRLRWGLAASAVALSALLALGFSHLTRQNPLCSGAEEIFAETWNPDRRKALEKTFLSSPLPFAADSWKATAARLEAYGQAWVDMHTETCEATRVRGDQSEELLDLRMDCLGQRLQEFSALTSLLQSGEAGVIEKAVPSVFALPRLSICRDTNALLAPLRLPEDVAVQRSIETTRGNLAAAKALQDAGQYDKVTQVVETAVTTADELAYWPLIAEATLRLARVQEIKSDPETAATYNRALLAAEAGRHDRAAAEAFIRLVRVEGYQRRDFDAAHNHARHAEALVLQLSERQELTATLADHRGIVYFHQGHYELARKHHQEALEIYRRLLGEGHPEVARTLIRLSHVSSEEGDIREALNLREQAHAIRLEVLGPRHPEVAASLDLIGIAAFYLTDYERARTSHEKATAIYRDSFGEDHVRSATSWLHLANVQVASGDPEGALASYQRTLKIFETSLGDQHPNVAVALSNIGLVLLDLGQSELALEHYQRALSIQEEVYGESHPWVALTLYNLGEVLSQIGDYREALFHHQRALKIRLEILGEEHRMVARSLTGVGRALLGLGRPGPAIESLERALELRRDAEQDPPSQAAEAQFQLAQALIAGGRDPQRARRLAGSAREIWALEQGHEEELREVTAFLASLRR